MEMFHEPMRVVEERFTTSELFIMSWRSREVYAKMQPKERAKQLPQAPTDTEAPRNTAYSGLPQEFINADGELDLRQVRGDQAWQFLMRQGIHVPMVK